MAPNEKQKLAAEHQARLTSAMVNIQTIMEAQNNCNRYEDELWLLEIGTTLAEEKLKAQGTTQSYTMVVQTLNKATEAIDAAVMEYEKRLAEMLTQLEKLENVPAIEAAIKEAIMLNEKFKDLKDKNGSPAWKGLPVPNKTSKDYGQKK